MVQRRPAVQIRRLNNGFGDAAADASFSADVAAIRGCGGSNLCRNGGGGDTTISRSLQQRGWESSGSDGAACPQVAMKWLVRPVAGRRDAVDCAILRGLVDRLL
jgi:hypothetical protein